MPSARWPPAHSPPCSTAWSPAGRSSGGSPIWSSPPSPRSPDDGPPSHLPPRRGERHGHRRGGGGPPRPAAGPGRCVRRGDGRRRAAAVGRPPPRWRPGGSSGRAGHRGHRPGRPGGTGRRSPHRRAGGRGGPGHRLRPDRPPRPGPPADHGVGRGGGTARAGRRYGMTSPGASGERGSATVWMLAVSGVLAVLGVAAVLTGVAVVARHRATAAADLAALAGAVRAVQSVDACGIAARLARANDAELTGCEVRDGAVVEVAVAVPVRLGRLGVFSATARARAGPVLRSALVGGAVAGGLLEDRTLPGGELVEHHVEDAHRARLVE